jgi:prepilin-type N-terminal cleavage/methylation domain-containing protein/prepilin-type processing-associated H-X9-DG protein
MIRSSATAKGFTLIELLVVVIIIGLLVGLLMPGLLAALRGFDAVRCQSNMGQLAKALIEYYTKTSPQALPGNANDPQSAQWMFITDTGGGADVNKQIIGGVLLRYTENNPKAYLCPTLSAQTDRGGDKVACHYAIPTLVSGAPLENCRQAYYMPTSGGAQIKLPGVPIVVEPEVYLNSDGTMANSLGVYNTTTSAWTTLPNGAFEGGQQLDCRRHNNRIHLAFHDGNVKAFNLTDTEPPASGFHVIFSVGNGMVDKAMGGSGLTFGNWAN